MAVAPLLPERTRLSIAEQIGGMAFAQDAGPATLVEASGMALAESLPVVMLSLAAIATGKGALSETVRYTGRWHHQVAAPSGWLAARSLATHQRDGDAAHEVVELAASTIPGDLARTIGWIDKNMPGDQQATMLVIPAYYLTAVMLRSDAGDHVVVSQRPERLDAIAVDRPYEGREFVTLLRQYPPSAGIPERG